MENHRRRTLPRGVRPYIPPGASGLLQGIGAALAGDPGLLRQWEAGPRRVLEAALAGWIRDSTLAGEVVQDIRIAALGAVRRGVPVQSEAAWISGVAARSWKRHDSWSRRGGTSLPGEFSTILQSGAVECSFPSEGTEIRDSFRELFFALPPPFHISLYLHHLCGWSVRDVAWYLDRWTGLSEEGTRRVLREGRAMVIAILAGEDAIRRWPHRFLRNSRWTATPPPFIAALYEARVRSGPTTGGAARDSTAG